jgi:hypothetical protein
LDLKKIGTSAAVGVVDNLLVELQDKGMLTGNLAYARDIFRFGAAFGGLLVSQYTRGTVSEIAENMCIASLPLAIHSIRELVKKSFSYSRPVVLIPNPSPVSVSPVHGARPTTIASY